MAKKLSKQRIQTFYKNNRIYCILMAVSMICILILGIVMISHFLLQAASSSYGNRLKDISDHPISTDLKEIESFTKDSAGVKSVTARDQGRIVYITVDMDDTKTNEDIQNLATSILEKVSDDVKSYYDIQFIFTRDSYNPYLGSKSHSNTIITWGNYKFEVEETTTTTKKK